ncbi:hypothetical protein [Oceanirhabdus sp. W0125-5]|nr:hypothetical protein [Oceanirhabdus sp. W0125-5]WBW97390.1 hypothetical protein OW730_00620 [Oceanirhabdus sp. W0125-5]
MWYNYETIKDQLFQTHPSIANRVRVIEKECGMAFVLSEDKIELD